MGIDLATWRARIGLNYYHMCRPLQTRWRSSGGRLYQPGIASCGVGEVMNDTLLVLKGCMTVVALSLILKYVVHSWSKLKGRVGGGKVHCHWRKSTSPVKVTVNGGGTLLLRAIMVVVPLLLVIAGDVETNPGPEGAVPTLKAAINALHSVCPKWYNIGVQLEVPTFQLKIIERKTNDSMDQLRDTLDFWMSNDLSPSWKHIADALKAPSVGENRLAKAIEEEYCDSEKQSSCSESNASVQTKHHQEVPNQGNKKTSEGTSFAAAPGTMVTAESSTVPVQHTMEEPKSPTKVEESEESLTTSSATHQGCTSPLPNETSHRSPFGCGCGKCTFFSFIERGCPTPIPSASSFPYLDLSELTHDQQQELRGRLWSDSQEIMMQFQKLVSATIKSFQRRCVPLDDLVSHVMTLGTFDPVFKEPQAPVFCHCLKELKTADTIPKVFMVLNDYFSFFNYHIIEHIIKALGSQNDKAELQRYKDDFNQYANRRIFECLPEFGPVSDADHADVFVKLDSPYDNYTVAQIEGFRHKLSEILCVSSQGILRLCRVDKGCFQLMFQVPSFVQQEIFPLSRKQEMALEDEEVIRLTCGEYQFLRDEPQTRNGKGHQHDADDDSGMTLGIFTDTNSTTFSEDHLDKEMKELDYELKLQGLVETASSHKSEGHLDLHFAVAMRQLEYVKYLVEKEHCNPMHRNQDGLSAFHMIAIVGDMLAFKYFVSEHNCNPACPGLFGLTPLHLASGQGHLDVVKYLVIEQQIDPLCEDEYGNTPLHLACAGGCQAVVEFLTSEIKMYITIKLLVGDLKNNWNSTPVHNAVTHGHLDILHFFISDQNCDPNSPGQYGRTLLHYAAAFGHLHIVKYLTDKQDCNPSCSDENKFTPLHCAAMKGHTEIVKFLVAAKHCDPMCRDLNDDTPLHMAAGNGHKEMVKFLTIEMHCDPTSRNAYNQTAVHLAAINGHLDIVKFFISDQNCDPNLPGQHGRTLLHYAAEFGHLHIVKYLIDEQGCNPSCLDEHKYTPLHLAATKGHMDIVKFLTMEKHCDSMCKDLNENTPLHMAAGNGHIDIVKFLTIEMHCDPTSRNANNITALHLVVVKGHLDIAHFFISDLNCDPSIQGQDGRTPLHYAAECGHLHIVKYLTDEQDCNPSCSDENKFTPLHCAAMKGHTEIVKFLVAAKHCDPMCRDLNEDTPLHMAAGNGHKEMVKFLTIEMHCDPTSRNAYNQTAVHLAAINGHLDIVKFFISDQNCDPNLPGQHGRTLLHYAAEFGHLHIVKYLIDEQGCNPSCLDEHKYTPLHLAATKGHMDIVKFLTMEKHCDSMCKDLNENTPLHMAAGNGHIDIVKFLTIEMHCDPTSRNANNITALHLVVVKGHLDIAHFFISDLNCDPSIQGQDGRTPLHYAAECGHLHIVKYLIDAQGCNPSCLDENKLTPLHHAAMKGCIDVFKFLTVEKHCDPMCRDFKQNTPLQWAAICGHTDIVNFFTLEIHCDKRSKQKFESSQAGVENKQDESVAEQLKSTSLQYMTENSNRPAKVEMSEDDHYLAICEQVMCESGKMDQTIMHCIFVGPPGVGKSSLLKRLLRMKLDPNRTSTQVVEKSVRVEIIRDVSTAVAQVSGLDWKIMEDPISQASGLIGQLSTKPAKISKVGDHVSKKVEGTVTQASGKTGEISSKQIKEENLSTVGNSNSQASGKDEEVSSKEESSTVGNLNKQVSRQLAPQVPTSQVSEHITSESSEPSQHYQFHKTIDFLRHVLKKKGISGLQKNINPWTLYLTDSGGQPEFQELLPALVVGPCVFFVVLPLNKDLNEKYEVDYMRPGEQKYIQKYFSSLSVQEDLMRSLASIASTQYKDKNGKEIKPRVMLIATFKDEVPQEEDRQRKLKELEALIKETDAFRQGMIVDASETQMVFTINNISDEESATDTKVIRDAFKIIANGFHVNMPSPWLFFSILIQHEYAKDSVISKNECFEIAKECGIHNETEFEAALQFLHRQTGVLHYYKEPPELNQIVIKDPQYLFSRVNQLVEETFTFDNTQCSQCTDDFKKGIFKLTDYETMTNKFGQSKLNPSMLLKLLEHLNVVVPLGDGERYFMPCAIAHLKEDTSVGHTRSAIIPALLITFKSGYCPKGLFGALVACIANKQVSNCTLHLDESKIHRDQICFTMDQHCLLLRVNPTYIYVEVIPYSPNAPRSTFCTICNGVRKLILENIKIACKTLHYSNSANYCLSFECPCDQYAQHEKSHPAVLRCDLNNCFWCIQSKKVIEVKEKCYIWLPQPNIIQHPVRQSVASETEAVFRVESTGECLQFQWQKNCIDLCDDGKYCGTNTDTLRIIEVEKSDKGCYRCLVKNDMGKKFSEEAFLTITSAELPPFPEPPPDPPPGILQQSAQLACPQYPSSQQLYSGGNGIALSEQDLHILTDIMRPATPQWRTIGGSLGFLDSDLNIIQHSPSLFPEGPPGYFREMLSQWLKWAPPKHPWPTLKALSVALQSIGHECLAVNLALFYVQRKADCHKVTHRHTAYYNWKKVLKTGGIICVLVLVLLAGIGIGMLYLLVRKDQCKDLERPHPDEL